MGLIFIPLTIIIACSFTYIISKWHTSNENWIMPVIIAIFIFSIVMVIMLGLLGIVINDNDSTIPERDNKKTKYDLLQYKINDFNNADNEEKVQILLNDSLLEDIKNWNNEKVEYEKLQNNIWIGFLYPDIYIDTDYISLLDE